MFDYNARVYRSFYSFTTIVNSSTKYLHNTLCTRTITKNSYYSLLTNLIIFINIKLITFSNLTLNKIHEKTRLYAAVIFARKS